MQFIELQLFFLFVDMVSVYFVISMWSFHKKYQLYMCTHMDLHVAGGKSETQMIKFT